MDRIISLLLLVLAVTAGLGLMHVLRDMPAALALFDQQPEDFYIMLGLGLLLTTLLGYWAYGGIAILQQRSVSHPNLVYLMSCLVATLGLIFGVLGLAQPVDQGFGMLLAAACLVSAVIISWFTHEHEASMI